MENKLCDCCGENPISYVSRANSSDTCAQCETTHTCDSCNRESLEQPIYIWERAECASCKKAKEVTEWLFNTREEIDALALKHGWSQDDYWRQASTGSCYARFSKEIPDNDEDEETTTKYLSVRVSDHGTAYCSEDISIAYEPSGDDHSLDHLRTVFARPDR